MRKIFLLILSCVLFCSTTFSQNDYTPKKVPSKPLNLQKLAAEIYDECLKEGGDLWTGGRQFFAIDEFDNTIFEFSANKSLARSGERACKFYKAPDGEMYFPRKIDYETSKSSQGILYQEMKNRWEQYLREKERNSDKK